MKQRTLTIILTLAALLFAADTFAQRMPERGLVRKGNRQYNRADYKSSIDNYSRALQYDPNCFEAKFNTANVQYRMAFQDTTTVNNQMLSKAENTLRKLAQDSTRTDIERGDVQYNLGNTLFAQQKLQDALDCYRNAMRFNPDDKEAKFNYALTKELLKQQQNQQQQNQNQDNQNDQNQDNQDQQQQPENQEDNKDEQDKQDQQNNQDEQDNQDQNQDEQQQPSEPQISENEQQAMLDAIQAQEDKTQEKLKEKKGILIRGGKNW